MLLDMPTGVHVSQTLFRGRPPPDSGTEPPVSLSHSPTLQMPWRHCELKKIIKIVIKTNKTHHRRLFVSTPRTHPMSNPPAPPILPTPFESGICMYPRHTRNPSSQPNGTSPFLFASIARQTYRYISFFISCRKACALLALSPSRPRQADVCP